MLWASRYVLLTDQQHVHAGVSSHVLQGQPAKSAANRGLDWVRGCHTGMHSSFAIQQRPAAAMCMHEMEVQKDKAALLFNNIQQLPCACMKWKYKKTKYLITSQEQPSMAFSVLFHYMARQSGDKGASKVTICHSGSAVNCARSKDSSTALCHLA